MSPLLFAAALLMPSQPPAPTAEPAPVEETPAAETPAAEATAEAPADETPGDADAPHVHCTGSECTKCSKHHSKCTGGECPKCKHGNCPKCKGGECPKYKDGNCPKCKDGECPKCKGGECPKRGNCPKCKAGNCPKCEGDNSPRCHGNKECNEGDEPWADVHLQVRPRAEKAFVGHLGVPRAPGALAGGDNFMTTSRIRLTGEGGVGNARARVSVQDVRTWGTESNTLTDFSADNVDFHEGWVELGGKTATLRLGRQEIALDGQRLIGAVNWAQQARSFDAALVKHTADSHEVTLFATRISDGFSHDVFAAHGMIKLDRIRLAVPLIFQTNAMIAAQDRGSQADAWHRFTGGVHASADGDLFWRAEAYIQTGANHFAYMFGGRAGLKINDMLKPMLWVDFLSGDNDLTDEDTGAFDTLFATNHKFYGYMDRFVAIPGDTRGGGLIDSSLKNQGKLGPGTLEVALHEFLLANADVSPATDDEHSRLIGFETDVVYAVPLSKWVKVVAGASLFIDQGDFREERRAVREDAPTVHDWFFVMLDMNI